MGRWGTLGGQRKDAVFNVVSGGDGRLALSLFADLVAVGVVAESGASDQSVVAVAHIKLDQLIACVKAAAGGFGDCAEETAFGFHPSIADWVERVVDAFVGVVDPGQSVGMIELVGRGFLIRAIGFFLLNPITVCIVTIQNTRNAGRRARVVDQSDAFGQVVLKIRACPVAGTLCRAQIGFVERRAELTSTKASADSAILGVLVERLEAVVAGHQRSAIAERIKG